MLRCLLDSEHDPVTQWPTHDGFLLYSDRELSVRVGTINSTSCSATSTWCPLTPIKPHQSAKRDRTPTSRTSASSTVLFPHRDTRNLRGEALRVDVASLRNLWGRIFYHTTTARWRVQRGSGHFHILFHCFAGINRFTAAAIAFLTQECSIPLRDLIECLCQVRPGQEYWPARDQFLPALIRLDQDLILYPRFQVRFV